MDTTLIGVTLLSMATAVALGVVVWRLLRDERRRSQARAAALADMLTRSATPDLTLRDPVRPPAPSPAPRRQTVTPRFAETMVRVADATRDNNDSAPPLAATFLAAPERASTWRARAVVIGALVLTASAALLIALTVHDRGRQHTAAAAATSRRQPAATLELLSLRDARDAGALTISGVVQNPRNGAMLKQVGVTASVFDAAGTLLATGKALVDVTALSPGDESPFVVSVHVSGPVARYRIGFRG